MRTADTVIIPPFDSSRIIREAPAAVAAAPASVAPGARLVSICTAPSSSPPRGSSTAGHHALGIRSLFHDWYPQAALDPDVLFIDDGGILTSAGAASGIDVCLHLVRKDYGSEVANRVARMCVDPVA